MTLWNPCDVSDRSCCDANDRMDPSDSFALWLGLSEYMLIDPSLETREMGLIVAHWMTPSSPSSS